MEEKLTLDSVKQIRKDLAILVVKTDKKILELESILSELKEIKNNETLVLDKLFNLESSLEETSEAKKES